MPLNPRPADPDVRVPKAVREAALRSEQFYQQPENENQNDTSTEGEDRNAASQRGEEQNDAQGGNGSSSTEPVVKVSSPATERARRRQERQSVGEADTREPSTGGAGTEGEPASEQVTQQVTGEEPQSPSRDDRRLNAMKGRAEHAERQIQQLQSQINGLQNVISTMNAQPQQAAQQDQAAAQQVMSLLTPEEREQYGDEFLNVVAKKAQEIVAPLRQELEDKIKRLDSQLGNVNQHVDLSAKEKMFSNLDGQIPEWRDVNEDPNFISWLQLPDTYSGDIRHNLLRRAFDRNDTKRVAAFFNGFLAEEAATAPQGQPRNQGTLSPTHSSMQEGETRQAPKTSLETLAAPGRAKSTAAQAPVEKPIFTRAQIAAFYTNVAAGKFQGKEKEKDRLEAQIFSAQQDGRIRN